MNHKTRGGRANTVRPRRRWPWLLVGGALVVAVGALFALLSAANKPATVAGSGARLAVDKQEVDFGKVPVNKMVTATFTVSNVGDAPLRILGEPQVRVVEGC